MARYIPPSASTLKEQVPQKRPKTSQIFKAVVSLTLCLALFVGLISPQIVWAASDALSQTTVASQSEPYEKSILFEEPSLREQDQKTYRMSDGSFKTVVYPEPIHYKNSNEWQDIDNTLVLDESLGGYTNLANDFTVTFAKKSDSKKLVEIKTDDYKLSWGFVDSASNKQAQKKTKVSSQDSAVLENLSDGIRYNDIYSNVDIEYLLTSKTLKENIVLKSKNTQNTFELELKLNGATAVLNSDRSISIVLVDGTVGATIVAPYMFDANGEISTDIEVSLSQSGNKYALTLTPSQSWLANEQRAYPVIIDPVITPTPATQTTSSVNMQDGVARTGLYAGRFYNSALGTSDLAYGFIGMTMPINPAEHIVQKVTVSLDAATRGSTMWNGSAYDNTTINKTIGIHSVSAPFYTSSQEASANIGAILDAASVSLDYSAAVSETYNFDITEFFYGGYDHTKINYLMLKEYNAPDTASAGTLPVCFTNFRIEYDYRSPKGVEEYLTYTEASIGNSGTIYLADATGNLVYARHLLTTNGEVAPISLGMVYENGTWRTNLNQTITKFSNGGTSTAYESELFEHGYPYMWIDGDGTEIYFHKTYEVDEEGNETAVLAGIEDETGKRLTLKELSNGNITITDTNGTVNTFELYSGNKYRLCKITDEFDNAIDIYYQSSSSTDISWLANNFSEEVGFEYTNGKLTSIHSTNFYNMDEQSVTIEYDQDGNLYSITDDATTRTVYGYTNGKLDKVLDSKSGYMVKLSTDGNKKTLQEYARVREDFDTNHIAAGQSIEITYNGTHTTFRTPGADGVVSDAQNSDDILTVYQFDNYLRTVSAYSKSYVGNTFYGAEQQEYTSGGLVFNSNTGKAENSSEKFGFNKIKSTVGTGDSTKDILANGNFELSLLADNLSPLDFCGSIFDCNDPIPAGSGATLSDYLTTDIATASDDTLVFSGNKALKVNLNAQGDALRDVWYAPIAKTASLEPNTEYTFSAYVRSSNLNAQNIRLAAKIGTAEYLSDKAITVTVNEDWRRVELRFTTPESFSGEGMFCLKLEAAGTVFVDCAQLEKGAAANAVNYAENQGFENTDTVSVSAWQRNNLLAADAIVESTQFGNKAFKINGSPSAVKSITQYVPIANATTTSEPRTFTISAFAKADALPANEEIEGRFFGIQAQFVYYDSETGENTYSEITESSYNPRQKDWQFASLSLTSDEGEILLGLKVTLAFNGQCGTCLFDNVSIEDNTVTNYEYDSLGNVVRIEVPGESETINTYEGTNPKTSTTVDTKKQKVESTTLSQQIPEGSAVSHTIDADVTFETIDNGNTTYEIIDSIDKINSVSYTAYDLWGRTLYTQTGTELLAGYTFQNSSTESLGIEPWDAYLSRVFISDSPAQNLDDAVFFDGNGYVEVANLDTSDFFTISFKAYQPEDYSSTLVSKYDAYGNEIFSIHTNGEFCWIEGLEETLYFYGLTCNYDCTELTFTFEKISDILVRITGYCNGYYDSTHIVYADLSYNDSDSSWYFGANVDGYGTVSNGYMGYMDDIAIFRGALSSYQAQKLYSDGLANAFEYNKTADWTYYDYGQDEILVQSEINSDGSSVSYGYDEGQVSSVKTTDRDGVTTRLVYEYNIDKTLKKVYNDTNKNSTWNSGEKYNSYTYDEYGNLDSVSHGDMSYTFEYNEFGQLCGVYVGDCYVVMYNYAEDPELGPLNSSLVSQIFPMELSDLEQSFVYDKLGNTIGKKNDGTYIQKWAYDKLGNLVFENDLEDGTQTSYQYDAQSRLTQRKASLLNNHSFTSQYLYNADSNITESAYNFTGTNSYDNSPINITFSDLYHYDDEDGKFIISDSGNVRNQTSYDDDSVTSRTSYYKKSDGTYRTVATETYSYYTSNQEGTIKDAVSEISYGNDTISYEYAANGNIIAEYKNGETSKSYVYDKLGQLTESYLYDYDAVYETVFCCVMAYGQDEIEVEEGDYIKFTYTYDNGNNMTSYSAVLHKSNGTQVTLYSRNMQYGNTMWDDQLCNYNEATDTYSHTYDSVGNLLSGGGYEYTWENGRELTSIKYKNDTESFLDFEYDSSGLRTSKTNIDLGTYYYAYDENSNLIFQKNDVYTLAFHYDGNGVRTHFDYILGDTVCGTYYYRYNLQGDVIALLNTSGTVVAEYFYDPYGRILNIMSEIGEINPFTYRGYYYDWETGFYYLQSRYYDPYSCRFINADSQFDQGAGLLAYNTYIYCANNPVNNIDPTGEFVISTAVLIGIGIGALIGGTAGGVYGYKKAVKNNVAKQDRWKYVVGYGLGGAVVGGVIGGFVGYGVGFLCGATSTSGVALKAISKALSSISQKTWGHIITKEHAWNLVLKKITQSGVKNLISQALKKGATTLIDKMVKKGVTSMIYESVYSYMGQKIIVHYAVIDGVIRISDAWVKTR